MPSATRQITSLRPDGRALGNLVVEVEGARFASLPVEVAASLELQEGLELDDAKYDQLSKVADVEAAYRVAIRLLAPRPRAVDELLRKLRERGHSKRATAEVVGRLEIKGWLDDQEFAREFARSRVARGHGPSRILRDLLHRGVERRLSERTIDEVMSAEGIETLEQARRLAERRATQLEGLPLAKARRRLLAYLDRRGYRGHEVIAVVNELLHES